VALARLDVGVVTFSHSVTVAGWIVIGLGFAAAWTGAIVSRGRFPTAGTVVRTATHHVAVRAVLLAGWAWVGWHFFVHTSR
jgi:hypothetical protein